MDSANIEMQLRDLQESYDALEMCMEVYSQSGGKKSTMVEMGIQSYHTHAV